MNIYIANSLFVNTSVYSVAIIPQFFLNKNDSDIRKGIKFDMTFNKKK